MECMYFVLEIFAGFWRGLKKAFVVYILILFIALVFAMAGHSFFGNSSRGDPELWGDFGTALFTLFRLLVLYNWVKVHERLYKAGVTCSSVFIVGFILLCSFILLLAARALLISEIQSAFQKAKERKKRAREEKAKKKREELLERAKQRHAPKPWSVKNLRRPLSHDQIINAQGKITSSSFIRIFMEQLDKRDQAMSEWYNLMENQPMPALKKEEYEDQCSALTLHQPLKSQNITI